MIRIVPRDKKREQINALQRTIPHACGVHLMPHVVLIVVGAACGLEANLKR